MTDFGGCFPYILAIDIQLGDMFWERTMILPYCEFLRSLVPK